MKRNISLWQTMGFGITVLCGTLMHFLYDFTGENPFAAAISAVNESTWEHMKLFFIPAFIFAIVQRRFFPQQKDFWCVKLIGIALGLILIPVLFYTYNGALGTSPDWVNIGIFIVSSAAAFYVETRLFKSASIRCSADYLGFVLLLLLAALFLFFTYFPPKLPLFQDPTNGSFGI